MVDSDSSVCGYSQETESKATGKSTGRSTNEVVLDERYRTASKEALAKINKMVMKHWIYCNKIQESSDDIVAVIEPYTKILKENIPQVLQEKDYYHEVDVHVPVLLEDPVVGVGLRGMRIAVFEAVDLFAYFKVDMFSKKEPNLACGMKSIRKLMGMSYVFGQSGGQCEI